MEYILYFLEYFIFKLNYPDIRFTYRNNLKKNLMKNIQASAVPVDSPDCQHIKIPRGDIFLAGNLYLPIDFDQNKPYPAIVVSHPGGGVKEQTAGTYARRLAEAGFVTIAFDASYQGASGGEPRGTDSPFNRADDISYVIDYFNTLPYVDSGKIGALGICAGGGATLYAVCTEFRIKACATISTFDVGESWRNSLGGKEGVIEELQKIAVQRENEALGDPILYIPIIPDTKQELPADAPQYLKDAVDYYRTPRGYHPRATNRDTFVSIADAIKFHPLINIPEMMNRPLLIISGDISDTRIYSEEAYNAATCQKELYLVKGAGHVDMYDKEPYVSEAVAKMAEFFTANLK